MSGKKKNSVRKAATRAAKPGAPRRGRFPVLIVACVIIIAGVAAASYYNSVAREFVFDNTVLVEKNPLVSQADGAGRIFTSNYWAPTQISNLYRPLPILTYHLQHPRDDMSGSKLSPRPFHIFNIVLHALNGVLAFFVLRRLAGIFAGAAADSFNVLFAAFGAALFAAHPITTEAVTNIVGRADLLVMFFLLLGLLSHMRGGERSGPGALPYYAFAAASMALALLSKENAIAMIAVFFAYDLLFQWQRRPVKTMSAFAGWLLQRLKSCYWLYVLVIAGWLFARYLVLRDLAITKSIYADNPLAYIPFLQREATAIVMLGFYLWRMLWPVTLSADYSAEQIPVAQSALDPRFLGSAAALIAVGVLAVIMWRRYPVAVFLILFFFIAIFPVSNIVLLTGTIGAERLLYVSSLGWAGCLAMGGVYAARILGGRYGKAWAAVPCALLGVIVALYGLRTHFRNNDWKDELTFWRATAATSDRSVRALQGYGLVLCRRNEPETLEEGRLVLERALTISDSYLSAHSTLGWIYNAMALRALTGGDPRKAQEYFEKAYEVMKRGERQDQMQTESMRNELAGTGKKGRPFISNMWELYSTLGRTCEYLAYLARTAGDREKNARFLAEARDSFYMALLIQTHEPTWHYEYGQILARIAELNVGDERTRLFDAAAVSLWRAVILKISGNNVWEKLRECYPPLGYNSDQLIPMSGTGFTFKKGENENREYQIRAFRSLIMLARAVYPDDDDTKVIEIAGLYDIPRSAIEDALRGRFSIDDPRILTGK